MLDLLQELSETLENMVCTLMPSLSLSHTHTPYPTDFQEPGSRYSVTVKLPYLDYSITMPDKVQRREVSKKTVDKNT